MTHAQPIYRQDLSDMTDADILAVLLNSSRYRPATMDDARSLAREVLGMFDNDLPRLAVQEPAALVYDGANERAAVTVAAAFELGRRALRVRTCETPLLNNPEAVYKFILPQFAAEVREVFIVIALDTSGRVIRFRRMTEGTLSASLVDARAAFKFAIMQNASSIIVCHNHPSGNLNPSKEDIQITKNLVYSGEFLDIPVHDHLILGPTGYLSMKSAGYL